MHAIYDRITVAGPEIVGVRLTQAAGMRDGHLRGALSPQATLRQMDVLAAYVAAGGSVQDAAELMGIQRSTAKRHLADLRARTGLSTELLIYIGRASGHLLVPSLERPEGAAGRPLRVKDGRATQDLAGAMCLPRADS